LFFALRGFWEKSPRRKKQKDNDGPLASGPVVRFFALLFRRNLPQRKKR
jgi:hypothetical protein